MLRFLRSKALAKVEENLKRAKQQYKGNLVIVKRNSDIKVKVLERTIRDRDWQLASVNDKLMHARVSQRHAEEQQRRVTHQLMSALKIIDGVDK